MSWMNIARVLKVVALVLFLTPWLVVSCQGSPLIEASGVDLITGNLEPSRDSAMGGFMAEAEAQAEARATSGDDAAANDGQPGAGVLEDGRWWVMLGAGLIGVALVLGFVLKPAKTAALGATAAGALALAVLGGGMAWTVKEFRAEIREGMEQSSPGGDDEVSQFGRSMAAGIAGGITIDVRWGFWMMLAGLGLGVAASGLAFTGAGVPQVTVGPRDG